MPTVICNILIKNNSSFELEQPQTEGSGTWTKGLPGDILPNSSGEATLEVEMEPGKTAENRFSYRTTEHDQIIGLIIKTTVQQINKPEGTYTIFHVIEALGGTLGITVASCKEEQTGSDPQQPSATFLLTPLVENKWAFHEQSLDEGDQDQWSYEAKGWIFRPGTQKWFKKAGSTEQPIEYTDVPLEDRQSLESWARFLIEEIMDGSDQVSEVNPPIVPDIAFEQGSGVQEASLAPGDLFGSAGSKPCLILIAWGNFEGQPPELPVRGIHDDSSYQSTSTSATMLEELEYLNLLVVGGEVGKHTGVEGATSDYSMYYPLFLAIDQDPCGAKIQVRNFPSNIDGLGASGAGISWTEATHLNPIILNPIMWRDPEDLA